MAGCLMQAGAHQMKQLICIDRFDDVFQVGDGGGIESGSSFQRRHIIGRKKK